MDLRIALISHEYPPFISGGVGTFCHDLSQELSKNEIDTVVITGKSRRRTIEKVNEHLQVVHLPFFSLPPKHFWFQFMNFSMPINLLKDISVLHCIKPDDSFISSHFKSKLRKPMVTSVHGLFRSDLKIFFRSPMSTWTLGDFVYNVGEYPLNEFFFQNALAKSDRLITCSNSTLSEIKRIYPKYPQKKMDVIYNAIKMNKFDEINLKYSDRSIECDQIVFYGRLFWRKGIIYLLHAMKYISKDYPHLKVQIFGRGPMFNFFKKLISNMNLKKMVSLRGYVPYSELFRNIKMADAVVFPSLYEAQSIAMLEAMALRKPVIAFNLPFARECIFNYQNGLLAKPGDSRDLADKIKELLSDDELKVNLGRNAYEYVKKNHNWDNQIKKYIKIYENLSSNE